MSELPLVCPDGITLLLGGARSGKSDLAVRLGVAWGGPVTVVATCEPGSDEALVARVARHRAERPATWTTIEESVEVPTAVESVTPGELVIVDCVTLWMARLVVDGLDEDRAARHAEALLDACARRDAPVLLVSNEVGLGVHPSTPLGAAFRDVLGRANRRLSQSADRCVLLVAGRVVDLASVHEVFS